MKYTKEEVLEAINNAFYAGVDAGQVQHGDENFLAEDYLPKNK